MAEVVIPFVLDGDVPLDEIDQILDGHDFSQTRGAFKDQAVLAGLEDAGAIIITTNGKLYKALRRKPVHDSGYYRRAGVVLIPGAWEDAATLLEYWLPLIETVYLMKQKEEDSRVVIELRTSGIAIVDQ